MKKSSKSKYKKHRKKGKEATSKYEVFKRSSKTWFGFLLRNLLIGIVFFIVFQSLYNNTQSYKWIKNVFFHENYNFIKKHRDFTTDKKLQAKIGYVASYLQFIKKHTPDSAIILMPPDSIIKGVDKRHKMDWLTSKRHATYFLYPRKPVYQKNPEDSVYLKKITYVAIVNNFGYQYLPFRVKNKVAYTVIPVDIKKIGRYKKNK